VLQARRWHQPAYHGRAYAVSHPNEDRSMRAEIVNLASEIEQGLTLLRRHL